MTKLPLFHSARAVADGNGKAVVTFGPVKAFERWQIERITIQSSSQTLVPEFRLYKGAETDSRLVDGSHTGTLDHSDTQLFLQTGEHLIAVWLDSDVGASCTITVEGGSIR